MKPVEELLLEEIAKDPYLRNVEDFMDSAWIGHAPFLKFLIRETRPSTFVELGVHNGFSYFVGCQSMSENVIEGKAFAIDHWQGDSQAGFFDESVYKSVEQINAKYQNFSSLLKMDFSQALIHFSPNSIDLLHIDGFHNYETVKNDFQSWLPKMNANGIVLLHDIHVRRDTFGVHRLWSEICERFPTLEFTGSHGLGVVFLGNTSGKIDSLRKIADRGMIAQIQGTFGSVADEVIQSSRNPHIARIESEIRGLVAERDGLVAERESIKKERDSILNSTTWKITEPYRRGLRKLRSLQD